MSLNFYVCRRTDARFRKPETADDLSRHVRYTVLSMFLQKVHSAFENVMNIVNLPEIRVAQWPKKSVKKVNLHRSAPAKTQCCYVSMAFYHAIDKSILRLIRQLGHACHSTGCCWLGIAPRAKILKMSAWLPHPKW